jgi:hypothetical protein
VPVERIELPTFGLQNRCSTAELNRQILGSSIRCHYQLTNILATLALSWPYRQALCHLTNRLSRFLVTALRPLSVIPQQDASVMA